MDSNEIARIAKAAGQTVADLVVFNDVVARLDRSRRNDEPIRLSGRESTILLEFMVILRGGPDGV